MFYDLIDDYSSRYGYYLSYNAINHLKDFGDRIKQKLGNTYKSPTEIETYDYIQSLILSRSYDIFLTKIDMIKISIFDQSDYGDNIDIPDIQFSIISLGCCPAIVECCKNMVNNSLNYVLVFSNDIDMLKAQGITTITEIPQRIKSLDIDQLINNMMVSNTSKIDETIKEVYSALYKKKFQIWLKSSTEIALPLMNIFE
jgi:hypothetical protein